MICLTLASLAFIAPGMPGPGILGPGALLHLPPAPPAPRAHGFDPAVVSAEALWVVHVDFRGFVESNLFAKIQEHVDVAVSEDAGDAEEEGLNIQLDLGSKGRSGHELAEEYGFDIEDLLDVTIYGSSDDEEQAVLVAHTTSRIDGLLAKVHDKHPELGYLDSGGRRFHAIHGDDDGVLLYVLPQTTTQQGSRNVVSDERTVVIGSQEELMHAAIDRLEKSGPGLGHSVHSVLQRQPRQDAFVWVAAVQDAERWHWDVDSAVAAKAESFTLELGEREAELFLDMAIDTHQAADALDIVSTLQGLQAMARLMAPKGPEGQLFNELLGSFSIVHDGARAQVSFEIETERLFEMVHEVAPDMLRDLSEAR